MKEQRFMSELSCIFPVTNPITVKYLKYKILCIVVMYPTEIMAPRILLTFLHFQRWVMETFNFISWNWWFVHPSWLYDSTVAPAAQTKTQVNITKNRIKLCANGIIPWHNLIVTHNLACDSISLLIQHA